MDIRKKQAEHPYTIAPNALISHESLSVDARFIVIYIESKPEKWKARSLDMRRELGRYDPATKSRKPIGREKFSGIMRELVAAGYAEIIPARGEDGRIRGKYYSISAIPRAGFSDSRKNRQPEKPTAGKPGHIVSKELEVNKEYITSKESETGVKKIALPQENFSSWFFKLFQARPTAYCNTLIVKLTPEDVSKIRSHLPLYIDTTSPQKSQSDKPWRANPETYLSKRKYLDPIEAKPQQASTYVRPKLFREK